MELKDIRSVPVGYMVIHEMFPMDFFKFYRANRVSEQILEKMMDLFWLYLIVDGMPAAVQRYMDTNNLNEVLRVQQGIEPFVG